jgi:AcrR family transcriptional regulator
VTPPSSRPRRLGAHERREQLTRVAMAILTEDGYEALSCDAVAQRAGVTRNLVYHYFRGGVLDVFRAAVDVAGEDLSARWTTDPAMPLDERRAQNFAAMAGHAAARTPAWAVTRLAASSADPGVRARHRGYRDRIVAAMALNALGTVQPSPLERAALEGYIAFAETILDAARERGLPMDEVVTLLQRTLEAALLAAAAG